MLVTSVAPPASGRSAPTQSISAGRSGVARGELRTGEVLKRKARQEVGRQREDAVQLELGLPVERSHNPAVQEFLRAVDDEAPIANRAAGVDAAAEPDVVREPGIDGDIEEVVRAVELAELLRLA